MAKKNKSILSTNFNLTPPELMEEIEKQANGPSVQKLPEKDQGSKESPMQKVRKKAVGTVRKKRISAATLPNDGGWSPDSRRTKISNNRIKKVRASISDHIRHVIQEPYPDNPEMTYAESIARKIAQKAARGENQAIEFVRDSTEGRPGQAPKKKEPLDQFETEIQAIEINLMNQIANSIRKDQ